MSNCSDGGASLKSVLIFILFVFVLCACEQQGESNNNLSSNNIPLEQHQGIIVEKKDNQVLVLSNTDEENITNNTVDELIIMAQEKDGAYYNVTAEEYNDLKVGAHVVIYWNGSQLDSDPPQRGVEKMEIISSK